MEASILETRRTLWRDEAACAGDAGRIADVLAGDADAAVRDAFIELHGTLGAGKTTFVRHLLHALGVEGAIKSPTYTLLEPYRAASGRGGFDVSHFDFYRFDDPGEWEDAGFRDVFSSPGLKVCEWPEKAAELLPAADLRITIVPLESPSADADAGDATSAPREVLYESTSAAGSSLLSRIGHAP